jgi:hypothetical protein
MARSRPRASLRLLLLTDSGVIGDRRSAVALTEHDTQRRLRLMMGLVFWCLGGGILEFRVQGLGIGGMTFRVQGLGPRV